jgi:REP element-mobilizing transposase RayT
MTVERRGTGWLTPETHSGILVVLGKTMRLYELACPIYCLMPDHVHLLWLGLAPASDQLSAARYFRKHTQPFLRPFRWQREAYERVLTESERGRTGVASLIEYISANPIRAGLVESAGEYRFAGRELSQLETFGCSSVQSDRDAFWEAYNRRADGTGTLG